MLPRQDHSSGLCQCYKKVWETLSEKVLDVTGRVLSPSKIVTDYELSKRNCNELNAKAVSPDQIFPIADPHQRLKDC
jgi:hypothetical protein